MAREGTKKTVFTNFMELCKSMNRNHEHVLVRPAPPPAPAPPAAAGCWWGAPSRPGPCLLAVAPAPGCVPAAASGGRAAARGSVHISAARNPPTPPTPGRPQQFLLAELGTSGSLDGTQRLIVKGRFLPKVFETVLRRWAAGCLPAGTRVVAHPRACLPAVSAPACQHSIGRLPS